MPVELHHCKQLANCISNLRLERKCLSHLTRRGTLSGRVIARAGTEWHVVYNVQLVVALVLTFSREVIAAGDLGFARDAAVQCMTLFIETGTRRPMYAAIN